MKVGDKAAFKRWEGGIVTFIPSMEDYVDVQAIIKDDDVHNDGGSVLRLQFNDGITWVVERDNVYLTEEPKDEHYNNDHGSLYLFAQQHNLNAWEFEVIKRIVRCRKKGEFISDIEKTKRVLDLYLKEQGHNYENQVEKLNK